MTVKSCGMLDPYWLRDSLVAELGARRVFHLLPYQVERLLIMARMVRDEYAERVDPLAMSTVNFAVVLTDLLVFGDEYAADYLAAFRADHAVFTQWCETREGVEK